MRRRAAAPGSAAAGRKEKFDETKIPIMKKALKIAGIALALLLAAALVVPMAFRGTLGEVVRREANARLAARLDDFGSLDLSLLRHFPTRRSN